MLKQDLYADEDKYNAACGFGFGLVFCAENSAGEGVDTGSHASMNIVLTSILLVSFSSSFERASRSMLPPMSTSSPDAKKAGAYAPA